MVVKLIVGFTLFTGKNRILFLILSEGLITANALVQTLEVVYHKKWEENKVPYALTLTQQNMIKQSNDNGES